MTDVRVPTLGESVTEATVATWFKQPGDSINIDEMLCELETDKVTVEVPSPVAGIMGEIIAQEGTVVSMDALLTTIGEGTTKKSTDKAKDTSKKENEVGTISRTEINVPTLGESVSEATVATWFKRVGDEVKQDEMVCELETDKVSVEVPSPVSGFLEEIPSDKKRTFISLFLEYLDIIPPHPKTSSSGWEAIIKIFESEIN